MSIQVGDRIPSATLKTMGPDGPKDISTEELFNGKRVVLFAVPGAFTPGCSKAHLPGFVVHADEILDKGVDEIVCMSVNDAFVMHAWGEAQNAEKITMVADGNADFTTALGLEMDARGYGMGVRSKRMAMIVEDGSVTHLALEPGGGVKETSAEAILEALRQSGTERPRA